MVNIIAGTVREVQVPSKESRRSGGGGAVEERTGMCLSVCFKLSILIMSLKD